MADSLFSQLKSRGEEFLTEVSNNLMSNPSFIELLKKGVAAKEEVDKRVAEGLKTMNVATRKEVRALENRLADLEKEIAAARERAAKASKSTKARKKK
jgi:predicted  nucleic acid-binding Zn-ribbon protein